MKKQKFKKPEMKTLQEELAKVQAPEVKKRPQYVYWVSYVDANNKFNTAILYLRYKLDTPENLSQIEKESYEHFKRNFRCLVNFKLIQEIMVEDKDA